MGIHQFLYLGFLLHSLIFPEIREVTNLKRLSMPFIMCKNGLESDVSHKNLYPSFFLKLNQQKVVRVLKSVTP